MSPNDHGNEDSRRGRSSFARPSPSQEDDDASAVFGAAAHEIKNALGPLAMTLQLAERQAKGGQPVAPADLAFARAQVRRLGALVNDLLDQTRADLGNLAFHPRPADLGAVVAEAVDTFRRGKPSSVVVDTDGLSVDEVVERVQRIVAERLRVSR